MGVYGLFSSSDPVGFPRVMSCAELGRRVDPNKRKYPRLGIKQERVEEHIGLANWWIAHPSSVFYEESIA